MLSDDLSCNKSAIQSHTYTGWSKYYASSAVDRNTSSCMRIEIGRNSLQRTVWWKVDLGIEYSIYSISILFKIYNGYGIYFCLKESATFQTPRLKGLLHIYSVIADTFVSIALLGFH